MKERYKKYTVDIPEDMKMEWSDEKFGSCKKKSRASGISRRILCTIFIRMKMAMF